MYRWFLAMRWLLSRPINVLGVLGVTLGVWALIVVVSIFSGYIREVRQHIRATTADVSIANLPANCSFRDVEQILRRDPEVAACAPRLVWVGLLHPTSRRVRDPEVPAADRELGEDSRFVHLLGIEPARELAVTGVAGWLDAVADAALRVDPTELLAGGGARPPIVVSQRRARLEGVHRGDPLRLTCGRIHLRGEQSVHTEDVEVTVQGAFATKYVLFDATTALLHADTLRHLLGILPADGCNVVAVKLAPGADADAAAKRIARALRDEFGRVLVQTWEETNAAFLSAVDHQRSLMKLVLFVIMVVAAFLMFATLSMMVTEKTHDIGILTAMGATRYGVLQVFLSCGLSIVLIGTVSGLLLGCASAVYLDSFNQWMRATFAVDLFPTTIYNLERVPYSLDPLWLAQVAGMALGVGLLVSGIPAWRAARHDPVESLRAE